MTKEVLLAADEKMRKALQALGRGLATIRTGRATPALVDHIKVDCYGVPTLLNQIATISVPEARVLLIQPWDRNSLPGIEKAILKSELGLNPTNDGTVIRLVLPPLTEERRRELVKVVKKRVEGGKIELRSLRREAVEELRKKEKAKEISQDEGKRALEQLQELTDSFIEEADRLGQNKEAEIMEI